MPESNSIERCLKVFAKFNNRVDPKAVVPAAENKRFRPHVGGK
jgi:hypothetical protein